MGREKALAFLGICAIAVVLNLKNLSILVSREPVAQSPGEPALLEVTDVRCSHWSSRIINPVLALGRLDTASNDLSKDCLC